MTMDHDSIILNVFLNFSLIATNYDVFVFRNAKFYYI